VPTFLRDRATVIHPTIDPLSHKNRDLSLHKLVGIMSDAALVTPDWPLLDPPFAEGARRLQTDGSFAPANLPEEIGLLGRPIVTQVSRWDRLKGFDHLLSAFEIMKADKAAAVRDPRHRRRLEGVRLVLAGPDPAGIADDPEGLDVLRELTARYASLTASLQRDVAVVALPMTSRKHNALMVNVLQRASDIVVQNSLQEGFGLTVAEAMWKRLPVLGSGAASGIRLQLRDGVDGRLIHDPEDAASIAATLRDMLGDSDRLEQWGRSAQRRVQDEFLVLTELVRWLQLLAAL
jgi:trehalose synthase